MGKVKIGFVGVGGMGQCAHLKNYMTIPDCEVVAIAELREGLGRKVAARYGIPHVYKSHEEMLASEKLDAIEPFHPDRVVSRILGMGDVLSMIEKVEEAIDQKQAVEMQRKLIENDFTLEDFRDQIRQLRKLGPLESILSMMPQVGPFKDLKNVKVDEKEITRVVAIIDSMTPPERANHMLINGSRRRRIAKGSGTTVQEVNQLLKQYSQMRKMMKGFSGGLLGKRLGKMKLPDIMGQFQR